MPSQGYLLAHAFTSNSIIPVEDATVTITQKSPEGLFELIAIRLTDESGKTNSVAIETPDMAVSQVPSEKTPFSLVDITAEHPLYERIVVEDVQIFPDNVSIQNLQLIPLDEAPELWNQTEVFQVPPQNL